MILLFHNSEQITSCLLNGKELPSFNGSSLVNSFFDIAKAYPEELLVWAHETYKDHINEGAFSEIFHHQRIMASYTFSSYLPETIGYIEHSPFIKVNFDVTYPTWRMHQDIGGMFSSAILALEQSIQKSQNFNIVLHSLGKIGQSQGLLCYSEPKLLKPEVAINQLPDLKATTTDLFIFVAKHYKWVWKHFLLINYSIYLSRFPLAAWLKSCFNSQFPAKINLLEQVALPLLKPIDTSKINLDVIIPTIGRKAYLYDVLTDLTHQTLLPKCVIIVEQNPDTGSKSELDYLQTKTWPFKIIHQFTHRTGACNARNVALDLVKADWVFLADDDVRVLPNYLEDSLNFLFQFNSKVLVTECLREGEKSQNIKIKSWATFGSGTSLVCSNVIGDIRFNRALEFGYGEDVDFGMQIRNLGFDILFSTSTVLKHLKAPIGGFRTKPNLSWQNAVPLPKPSPTVLLSKILHLTPEQVLGYKSLLFFNTLKSKGFHHFFSHLSYFKKAWATSLCWAKKLNSN
jgi:glycosyltransferase involved in cell wall biosynthesis